MNPQLTYTKELMKHFKNPKYVKDIKNPSGIGEVGNIRCLLPDERIYTDYGSIKICDLKRGQKVLTHEGNYNNVNSVFSRDYKGEIIRLKNKLGEIKLTPEHLIHSIKIPKGSKFLRNKGKKQLIPAWYHAEQLNKGDIILYPLLKTQKDIKYLKINIKKLKYDFRSKEIPNKIPLNSDFLRLSGYFLAEGNIQDIITRTYITLAFHIKEKELIEDVKNIIKRLFNLDVKIRENPKNKVTIVYIYNAQLARFFKQLFGNGAEHKKIPEIFMNLSKEKQKELIYGLWMGDGYINLNRKGPRAVYVTISYQLAQQMKILLLRQKIVPSIYVDKERVSRWANHKESYRIHVGQRDSLKKLSEILNTKYSPITYESIKSWFDNNFLYTPITSIKKEYYNNKVYNLEVNNAHSFVQEAFCVHNCGDIMRMKIKIKDNKIKDIGFQTFGCPAALASSDVVCELAKGKTIEQAKKITKDNIVKKLGGMPPIKLHCSVLGIEALNKAIENYENKEKLKNVR